MGFFWLGPTVLYKSFAALFQKHVNAWKGGAKGKCILNHKYQITSQDFTFTIY